MKRSVVFLLAVLCIVSLAGTASATNGDNLIGIGPIARAMGGVGIAAPQDAISAVFANPAAMCFGPYCPGTEVNFAGTLFMPKIDASISSQAVTIPGLGTLPGFSVSAGADNKVYAIPAIGLSVPITSDWRFGLAAYGVSGLGVDYRGSSIDGMFPFPGTPLAQAPLAAGAYTSLQIMKFSPSVSYQATSNLSLGLGVQIDYANLDLRNGSSFNYGIGAQLGAIYKLPAAVTLGATYVTPQEVSYDNVVNLGGSDFNLKLTQPQQAGIGVSYEPIKDVLLFEVDGKWINWSGAKGYDDFDWKDQWVLAIGAQYKPTKALAIRAGYNYANNPVREHNGFIGNNGTPDLPITNVQGIPFPTYYYETFRIIGFPAIVKQHVTVGIGYEISKRFALNAGYTHAFKETISESGVNIAGQPTTLQSKLSENSIEFGFTWRF